MPSAPVVLSTRNAVAVEAAVVTANSCKNVAAAFRDGSELARPVELRPVGTGKPVIAMVSVADTAEGEVVAQDIRNAVSRIRTSKESAAPSNDLEAATVAR